MPYRHFWNTARIAVYVLCLGGGWYGKEQASVWAEATKKPTTRASPRKKRTFPPRKRTPVVRETRVTSKPAPPKSLPKARTALSKRTFTPSIRPIPFPSTQPKLPTKSKKRRNDRGTTRWESLFLLHSRKGLCGKKGRMLRLFRMKPIQCFRTFDHAQKVCRQAMNQLPHYHVLDATTADLWGKMWSICLGMTFNMRYVYKHPRVP